MADHEKFHYTLFDFFFFFCDRNKADDFGSVEQVIFHRCYDGDTCTVTIPGYPSIIGEKISVRLDGIDTPELRAKCANEKQRAREAKAFVNSLLSKAKNISLHNLQRGKYFRIVATIKADGVNVNQRLIEAGHAVPYSGKRKVNSWCP